MLLTENEIQEKLKYLAYKISNSFDEVTLLITLTGGVYTGVDLSKYITIPVKLEFVKISSYGDNEESGILDLKWISASKDKSLGNVIIVDDICDTGKTLEYLIKYIKLNYEYTSLHTLTLLDKPSRRESFIQPDYKGFTIDNVFVYGYGLDNEQYDRNLRGIKVKKEERTYANN